MTAACRIRVTGLVQGVGFRPHVWRLATETGVRGWVRNDSAGVEIAAEGGQLADFLERLKREAPPLARVDSIETRAVAPENFAGFEISKSQSSQYATTSIGHDTTVCADCLAEMFDPNGRRFRHAFITCTHCGPRYTVTRALPYDRPQTSLAPFPLCPDCEREYRDPADRRFHAETTCCPVCGPQLRLRDMQGRAIAGDPVAAALRLLQSGAIVAIKGLGGFHLACDATNAEAVAKLRERKAREEKPFAVMVADVNSLARFAAPGAEEIALLEARERPVLLVAKRPGADDALGGVSPRLTFLGAMLPYTPLQHLLFHDAPELVLVMTSANPGGEPLVIGNDEALVRLSGIADAVLDHDREILIRCDDSVRTKTQLIRRARGYTPRPIKLGKAGPSVLALGGWFKNTLCITRGNEAFVSQHVGDLDNAATVAFLEETVAHLLGILQVEPAIAVHDLHPDFASTRLAVQFAAERGIPALAVQHHHAHIAAVLAEHGHAGPALGLALDGVGLGSDGQAWGGELLRVDGASFSRFGHLEQIRLPGGDRAAREPWRMGAAALHRLGRGGEIEARYAGQPGAATIRQMLERGTNSPATSSCGRWFDAAAGLLGIKPVMAFEGQAAMLLEGLAAAHGPVAPLAGGWVVEGGRLSLMPLMAALADMGEGGDAGRGAALFHDTLAAALAEWVSAAAEREKMDTVALGGGCFLNRLLSSAVELRLLQAGFKVLAARQVPPNDGGLSLGQAWVALQTEY
ncbi:MAG TPA: carbamoyltransferase HypF [Rhodocyclaceae bacterium]|nr:carbamoyltransferase HypF [Rhodocyclaceae bacterium]